MKRKYILILTIVIFASLVALTFLSTAHHSALCSDIDCEICAQVQNLKKILENILFVAFAFGIVVLTSHALGFLRSDRVSEYNLTPVILKVKLSN